MNIILHISKGKKEVVADSQFRLRTPLCPVEVLAHLAAPGEWHKHNCNCSFFVQQRAPNTLTLNPKPPLVRPTTTKSSTFSYFADALIQSD